jgi:hypothetical protein
MKYLPVLLHGLSLTVVNVGAVLVGFAFYKVTGISNQLAAQVPAAASVSVVAFALWYAVARRVGGERLSLRGPSAYAATYAVAFGWLPALFVPLHYATQGYLTSFANIYYMWLFQAPTNALTLAAAAFAGRRAAKQEVAWDRKGEA